MFLKEEEASWFLGFLLLVLEEEMDLEWLLDNSDEVVGDKRNIPIIFIRHRWISDPVKKASEPLLTSAAAANIDYSYVFPSPSGSVFFFGECWTKTTDIRTWNSSLMLDKGSKKSLELIVTQCSNNNNNNSLSQIHIYII